MHAFQISKQGLRRIGWVTRESLLSALRQQGKERVQKTAARGGGSIGDRWRGSRRAGAADGRCGGAAAWRGDGRPGPCGSTARARGCAPRGLQMGAASAVVPCRAVPCGGAPTARATRLSLSAPQQKPPSRRPTGPRWIHRSRGRERAFDFDQLCFERHACMGQRPRPPTSPRRDVASTSAVSSSPARAGTGHRTSGATVAQFPVSAHVLVAVCFAASRPGNESFERVK